MCWKRVCGRSIHLAYTFEGESPSVRYTRLGVDIGKKIPGSVGETRNAASQEMGCKVLRCLDAVTGQ